MPENPYQSPLSPPDNRPVEEHRGISVLAIFLGVLTDVGGTMVLSVVLGIVLAVYFIVQGVNPQEIATAARTPSIWLIGFVSGMCLTVLGGYVAGRVAKRSELLHGTITGLISATIALLMQLTQSNPIWYIAASTVIVPPLAILGARLSMIGRHRQQITTDAP